MTAKSFIVIGAKNVVTFKNYFLHENSGLTYGRHDTQHNDIQHSDTQRNGHIYNTQHNGLFTTLSIMKLNMMTLSIMTLNLMTLSIMTLSIMTLSIMTLSIMTLSIMTLSIMTRCSEHR